MKKKNIIVTLLLPSCFLYSCNTTRPSNIKNSETLNGVLHQYGGSAQNRLVPFFNRAQINYPPKAVTIINNKTKHSTEIWARDHRCWQLIKRYPMTASSGQLGPKLRAHDGQIPEGIYKILYLKPNSQYHLSMLLDYPNEFDKSKAKNDGRTQLGSGIFIHGKADSIGCVAIGDSAIEELFTIVHDVGKHNVKVINMPYDLRRKRIFIPTNAPKWSKELYQHIARALYKLKPICHA